MYKILEIDPLLTPFAGDIELRMNRYRKMRKRIAGDNGSLAAFANGHLFFGFHKTQDGWFYREWAPSARAVSLIGDFNGWNRESHKLTASDNGVWEIFIPGVESLPHESRVKIALTASNGNILERIPLYCKRAVQDEVTKNFDGQIWNPKYNFAWTDKSFSRDSSKPLMIYESHVGMSGEKEGISTYREYADNILPIAKNLGYNTIQLMAVMEHPYYGSFGYQVSNFFAASSRFGTPDELKYLVNKAHEIGIAVLLDLIHSHAASNTLEGIAEFDGTSYQFFHTGVKGNHPAWGTKLFDYSKPQVLHFLLSNLKFWMEEYHFDGFRFDGVTSMLYHNHGLGESFDCYEKYFTPNTDVEAVTYLQLAAELCKEINPASVLIAEDMSAMPGMCIPIESGGVGFDYRLGMGMPDFWIKTLKNQRDEDWDTGRMWYELNQRRPHEKVIGYCESHDQALVGDKTIMFWLADKEMYWSMSRQSPSHVIDRSMDLHKMIRLITCICAGEGYLNFMGNEFGHPEWIDFPREGNGWSYKYARRQWSLASDPNLRYKDLMEFDRSMIHFVRDFSLPLQPAHLIHHDECEKLLVFRKGEYIFIFNFHTNRDHIQPIDFPGCQQYRVVLHTNWQRFGGSVDEYTNPLDAARGISAHKRSAVVARMVLSTEISFQLPTQKSLRAKPNNPDAV